MKKIYLPLIWIVCGLILVSLYLFASQLQGYDITALAVADVILATLSVISYFIISKKLKEDRPQAFVNGVYSATLLRLMVCLGGIFTYAYATRQHLHKPTVFTMMGFYLIYTLLETVIMSKVVKK